ncbi:MAG: YraN family protein [Chitinophagaceae bacterium]|nr:YraN family protein [Chitinophagaceae bacterium]
MAHHNQTGIDGEQLAAVYFTKKDYTLLYQNWRHSRWEVDIIASKDNILHFIEVKTRRSKNFGLPEDHVDRKKIENLVNAAREFLYQNPQWERIQFDILSISIIKNEPIEYFLIEDISL